MATSLLKRELVQAGAEQVKPAYMGVLMCLWMDDDLNTAVLGRKAGLEPSSMTGLLDRMERDGLISRASDPTDRRAQRIRLTQQGIEIQSIVLPVVAATLHKMTKGITTDDLSRTKEILKQVLKNTQEEKLIS